MTRYDPAPLLAQYPGITDREVADHLGVTRETISRWRNGHSGINAYLADTLTITCLRLHPAELWPEWASETRLGGDP